MVHKYWYVGHVSIEPLKKNINYQFFLSDYGNRRTHAAWGWVIQMELNFRGLGLV